MVAFLQALESTVLQTFSLQIVNEYDQLHGLTVTPAERRPGRYMATRYLQLQHPGRQGRTSGDGRSIWNGTVSWRGRQWDISSCGTGATRFSPATANEGQLIRRGIRAAIIGRPNAGKSSLLNQLLGRDRAIVSAVAGTTRDTISEEAQIRGIAVVFIDTAGLQESGDAIEREGIRRSRESLGQADLVLHVLDASEPLTTDDETYLAEFADKPRILVLNKSDLPNQLGQTKANGSPSVSVCCLDGQGIEALKDAIRNRVWDGEITSEMLEVMINSRHQEALRRAGGSLQIAREQLRAGTPLDLVAVDLRIGTNAVGEIVGRTTTEDLLDSIFSTFCIGK